MQPRHPPQAVVQTLAGAFCKSRGLALAGEAKGGRGGAAPSGPGVVAAMERDGYVRLDARRASPRGRRDRVVFLVLASEGAYARHSPKLRQLLAGLFAEREAREGLLDEVVLVAEDAFFGQKYLTDLVAEHRGAADAARLRARAPPGDPEGVAVFFGAFNYSVFAFDVPAHVAVPRHTLLGAAEAEALLRSERLEPESLPLIRSDDPPVVWLGGRAGQIVEIERDSLSAARAPYYRRVVEAA